MSSDSTAQVKAHWDAQAVRADLSDAAITHADGNQRLLEVEFALRDLPRGQRLLDVGCGNGHSTAQFAPYGAHITAIDYSEGMIERARRTYGHLANVTFQVQDVLNLKLPEAAFDGAISQRCLINLTSWADQQKALANICRVIRPGGILILQEGTQQGRARLNEYRHRLGLSSMPPVPFNLDFDEELLWPWIRQSFYIVTIRRFGTYDLISRVVHPLLVSPAEPRYDARINEIARLVAAQLSVAEKLGREFSAVLRRLER